MHGRGGTREEGLRAVPALRALGMTVLSISYRNDPESIQGERVSYDYGRSEWEDLAAAVDYARDRGPAGSSSTATAWAAAWWLIT